MNVLDYAQYKMDQVFWSIVKSDLSDLSSLLPALSALY